jgi:hypothetical protein
MSRFADWADQDAMHVASLTLTAVDRLRSLARAGRLRRVRSAPDLARAMMAANFETELVRLAPILWSLFVDVDEAPPRRRQHRNIK